MLSDVKDNLIGFRWALEDFLQSPAILNKITELKQEELFAGLRGSGLDISPKYSEVPGFADWYNDWKKRNIPTYQLDDVPDLYIDGTFHRSLFTEMIDYGVYQTDSDYSRPFMYDVMQMHDQGDLLDLTEPNIEILCTEIENFFDSNLNV